MRMSLFWKLFVLQAAAAAALLLVVLWVLRAQTATSFAAYVEGRERQRLEDIAEQVAENYRVSNDLRQAALQVSELQPPVREHSRARARFRRAPLTVLDARGHWVAGAPIATRAEPGMPIQVPISVAGQMIGRISRPPMPVWVAPDELGFRDQQTRALLWSAAGGLLLAGLFAALISGLVQRPIRRLSRGAAALARRAFDTRMVVDRGDELGQLAEDFNHLAAALAQYEQQQRQWLADAAHELRTPLAILRAELEAMLDGVRALTPAALQSMQQEVQRLESLTDDLRELSLAEAGELALDLQPCDVGALLHGTASRYQAALRSAGFVLNLQAPESPLRARVDLARIEQVFSNLFSNILRHAQPGAVRLSAARMDNTVRITLADSGPGVRAQALPHLFDRLYRAGDDRARSSGGSGLGLAIVRSIVRAHGGDIGARLGEQGGLTIEIDLPLQPEPNL